MYIEGGSTVTATTSAAAAPLHLYDLKRINSITSKPRENTTKRCRRLEAVSNRFRTITDRYTNRFPISKIVTDENRDRGYYIRGYFGVIRALEHNQSID